MSIQDDNRLRLIAQRSLLGHVTPQLRAVSVDADPERYQVWVRFVYDGEPSAATREAASCAGSLILSDYSEGWDVAEEHVVCPATERMQHRRLLVYERCEDEFVSSG